MTHFIVPVELSYKEMVRAGCFSFEVLVKQLGEVGYITENSPIKKCELISPTMELFKQEDFDELFSFFYPDRENDIKILCVASDEGSERGAFSYALYNTNRITREQIMEILHRENSD